MTKTSCVLLITQKEFIESFDDKFRHANMSTRPLTISRLMSVKDRICWRPFAGLSAGYSNKRTAAPTQVLQPRMQFTWRFLNILPQPQIFANRPQTTTLKTSGSDFRLWRDALPSMRNLN